MGPRGGKGGPESLGSRNARSDGARYFFRLRGLCSGHAALDLLVREQGGRGSNWDRRSFFGLSQPVDQGALSSAPSVRS